MKKNRLSDNRPWHTFSPEATCEALTSTEQGLSQQEAERRVRQYGLNKLTPAASRGPIKRFFCQFHNVLVYVLLAAAGVTGAIGHWVDSGVIVGVVVINALIGFIQEGKAEKALDAIRNMLTLQAMVQRDGMRFLLTAEQLVPGDIVTLESGDKVPADLRLFQVKNLRADESMLTGESLPVEKNTAAVGIHAPLGDRVCLAYSGTLITYGTALGMVVATGDRTEIGRISSMLRTVTFVATPLLRQIAGFSKWLTLAILLLASATFAYGWAIQHSSLTDLFMSVVGLAVAAIPEGLPAIMTITLAIGVQRMAKRNAIIRRLPAVETLGSVTVICSDKTGTLTCNEMTVNSVVVNNKLFLVDGVGYKPQGDFKLAGETVSVDDHPYLYELLRAAVLCNNARLEKKSGNWIVHGDPTEGALITLAHKAGMDPDVLNQEMPRTDSIPFESEHCYMATLHHDLSGHAFVFIKGAPERVLAMCGLQRIDGEDIPLHAAPWQQMMDRELKAAIRNSDVFARTSPENKLRLVTALQADGQVVAMTGDGVNDAPALKRADVGVAMGKKGTEVAKEISEMVLADDNFASIAHAVEEGRGIYDNLKKAIIFILPTGVGEALTIVASSVFILVEIEKFFIRLFMPKAAAGKSRNTL